MGVHGISLGLTTFLRENRKLSETISLPSEGPKKNVQFVVDGWSLIYELFRKSNLSWVYGGEYVQFTSLLHKVVRAWLSVGVSGVSFVFDGPSPPIKHATVLSRLSESHVTPSILFFRTSPAARATPRYLNDPESRIIPPAYYSTAVQALLDLQSELNELEIYFADSEADPFAVELAARLKAYVVANDSDYAILNAEGYRGWIPLESMVWYALTPEGEQGEAEEEEEGDWTTFKRSKSKSKSSTWNRSIGRNNVGFGSGIIPPDSSNLSLSFTSHTPVSLASFLDVPATLLPLLGALVGNDYSKSALASGSTSGSTYTGRSKRKQLNHHMFFDSHLPPSGRITRVASTINSILSQSRSAKSKYHVSSVMDLIDKAVRALLIRPIDSLNSGELAGVIEGVVDATLQYAIPPFEGDADENGGLWQTDLCALHEPEICQLMPIFSRNVDRAVGEAVGELEDADSSVTGEDKEMEEGMDAEESHIDAELSAKIQTHLLVRDALIHAYRSGQLAPTILNILTSSSAGTGTMWGKLFLENPDLETTGKLTRPIRMWICSILDDAVGLPIPEPVEEKVEEEAVDASVNNEQDDEDSDELIDVVESDSNSDMDGPDVLAPLKGALQRLHEPQTPSVPSVSGEGDIAAPTKPPRSKVVVTDYVRRGMRINGEDVEITEWEEVLDSVSASGSDTPSNKPSNGVPITTSASVAALPFLLRPVSERLDIFLRLLIFSSATSTSYSPLSSTINTHLLPLLKSLPPSQLCLALAFRWLMGTLRDRANEARSILSSDPGGKSKEAKDKIQARWTEREARCLLASFVWDSSPIADQSVSDFNQRYEGYPPLNERSIQLTAQILQCMDGVHQLAEVMLLTGGASSSNLNEDREANSGSGSRYKSKSHSLPPSPSVSISAHLFSGKQFHAYLSGVLPLPPFPPLPSADGDTRTFTGHSIPNPTHSAAIPTLLWNACMYGFRSGDGEAFTEEAKARARVKKTKKDNEETEESGVVSTKTKTKGQAKNTKGGKAGGGRGGLFDLLGDVEA